MANDSRCDDEDHTWVPSKYQGYDSGGLSLNKEVQNQNNLMPLRQSGPMAMPSLVYAPRPYSAPRPFQTPS